MKIETEQPSLQTAFVLGVAAAWMLLAVVAERSGILRPSQLPLPLVVPPLVALLLTLYNRSRPLRTWFRTHLRVVLLFHSVRFAGICFLLLYQAGKMPFAFAVPGGIGDIYVAAGAILCAMAFDPTRPLAVQTRILIWNGLGLLDIVSVVSTAAYLALTDSSSIEPLWHLPLSLLPTFVVPLVIASHIAIFLMVRDERRQLVVRY